MCMVRGRRRKARGAVQHMVCEVYLILRRWCAVVGDYVTLAYSENGSAAAVAVQPRVQRATNKLEINT
jgi:hypothetical protein